MKLWTAELENIHTSRLINEKLRQWRRERHSEASGATVSSSHPRTRHGSRSDCQPIYYTYGKGEGSRCCQRWLLLSAEWTTQLKRPQIPFIYSFSIFNWSAGHRTHTQTPIHTVVFLQLWGRIVFCKSHFTLHWKTTYSKNFKPCRSWIEESVTHKFLLLPMATTETNPDTDRQETTTVSTQYDCEWATTSAGVGLIFHCLRKVL